MEVDFMDEVVNNVSGVTGTVDAIYTLDEISYVDVKVDDRMYYKSPTANWTVIAKYDPLA